MEKKREIINLAFGTFGAFIVAFNTLLPVFGMIVPDHDCNVAERDRFFNFSSTGIPSKYQYLKRSGLFRGNNETDHPWESIVTELFLVCDQASKVQTLFVIGIAAEIFSILFNGWLADTIGRKATLLWNNIFLFAAILINLIFINFYVYAVCRFIICSTLCCLNMTGSLYASEVAVHYESLPFLLWSGFSYVGILLASWLFYFFPDWKEQMLIKLILSFIFFFMTLYIPEPAAFLENKKSQKALKRKITKKFDVLPNVNFIITIIIFAIVCLTSSFVYYGLLWGAGDLSGSLHWNSAINGFMALAGTILILPLQKMATSKTIVSGSFFLICFVSGLAWIIPSARLLSVASFIGIFSVVLTYISYFDISKIFPVNCRSTCHGICTVSSRILILVIPYLSHLPQTFRIGSLCILPGICGFLYHFIPDVPDDVTLKNVSDANPVFKQSHMLMIKKRAILRNIFR